MPECREDGNCRIMHCQLNSCSGKEIRELKVEGIMKLRKKYDVNIAAMAEMDSALMQLNHPEVLPLGPSTVGRSELPRQKTYMTLENPSTNKAGLG